MSDDRFKKQATQDQDMQDKSDTKGGRSEMEEDVDMDYETLEEPEEAREPENGVM